ncbi:parkin coregulated gene protein homolog [Daphnia pulicaria]|uniref:parkin coregulated gene protein homolog n=1 Tax=Daphnia pulicaria TaxID=35523 RepID=UPI001EEB2A4F|nr:parkin coregulated gene protein homolog [Daphnia pulicaria]
MFDRSGGQSLTMRQAGQQQREYQQESGSSRSSSGSDGRSGRRGQPHQIRSARQSSSATVVPAFTIRSASQGRVQPPKRVNVFAERPSPSLAFRRIYQRGDLPVCIVHESRLYRLGWKVELDTLDYEHYLPLFLDGLCETQHPHEFLARKGAEDLITRAPDRVTPLLPVIIPPLRRALNTRNPRVICSTLKIIQLIATCSKESGRAFLPYYKSLLPILNLFKSVNLNQGDGIDYSQQKNSNLGDLIQETLEMLEKSGGSAAFVLIKNMVPTYESCVWK